MTLYSPESPLAVPLSGRSFHVMGRRALELLYQHRVLSTQQLHTLLTEPESRPPRPVYLRQQLGELRQAGLVSRVRAHGSGGPGRVRSLPYLWFLTEAGAESVEEAGELPVRPYRVTPESVAGARQAHTLAVSDVGIAFVEHARRLGHECGPLDWTPEVANRIRDGQRRFEDDHVISDALLNYVHIERGQRTMLSFFIEVDRATMTSARLAAKLAAYGRLYEYVPQGQDRGRRLVNATRPSWMYSYPVFPRVLVILDAAPPRAGQPDTRPQRLAARTEDLYTRTAADVRLSRLKGDLAIGVTTLQQLREHGPCAPIFTPLLRGTPSARPAPADLYLSK
ncbi:replication-relaxation family protein [Streptomyces graminilatus]|uniref:replication-relaxation family protein n=1 Tax=Streptomyces graminilatus TaxID=1464070 RepID=UPI0006E30127|nr:replication-relaxation family protein [Streptomyces graminilatus]